MKKAFLGFSVVAVFSGLCMSASADQLGQINFIGTTTGTFCNFGFLGESTIQFIPDGNSTGTDYLAYCTCRTTEAAPPFNWQADHTDTTQFQSVDPTTKLSTLNATEGEEIAYIVNTWGATSDINQATAVQLAVWDIAEGGTGLVNANTTTDLVLTDGISGALWGSGTTGGDFSGATLTDQQIINLAGTYASSAHGQMGTGNSTSDYFMAQRQTNGQPVSQDFVAPTPSPEPFTIGLGIAGIGVALRRRALRK